MHCSPAQLSNSAANFESPSRRSFDVDLSTSRDVLMKLKHMLLWEEMIE